MFYCLNLMSDESNAHQSDSAFALFTITSE